MEEQSIYNSLKIIESNYPSPLWEILEKKSFVCLYDDYDTVDEVSFYELLQSVIYLSENISDTNNLEQLDEYRLSCFYLSIIQNFLLGIVSSYYNPYSFRIKKKNFNICKIQEFATKLETAIFSLFDKIYKLRPIYVNDYIKPDVDEEVLKSNLLTLDRNYDISLSEKSKEKTFMWRLQIDRIFERKFHRQPFYKLLKSIIFLLKLDLKRDTVEDLNRIINIEFRIHHIKFELDKLISRHYDPEGRYVLINLNDGHMECIEDLEFTIKAFVFNDYDAILEAKNDFQCKVVDD